MSKAKALIGLFILGIIGLLVVSVVNANLTGRQLDFYLLRETTNAAMLDAVDYGFYAQHGVIRMDSEKFVENFLRRFADGVDPSRYYQIDIYNINEAPPMVNIRIDSATNSAFRDVDIELTTTINAVLESINQSDIIVTNAINDDRMLGARPQDRR